VRRPPPPSLRWLAAAALVTLAAHGRTTARDRLQLAARQEPADGAAVVVLAEGGWNAVGDAAWGRNGGDGAAPGADGNDGGRGGDAFVRSEDGFAVARAGHGGVGGRGADAPGAAAGSGGNGGDGGRALALARGRGAARAVGGDGGNGGDGGDGASSGRAGRPGAAGHGRAAPPPRALAVHGRHGAAGRHGRAAVGVAPMAAAPGRAPAFAAPTLQTPKTEAGRVAVRLELHQAMPPDAPEEPPRLDALAVEPTLFATARFQPAPPLLESVAPEGTLPHALRQYGHLRHFLVAAPDVASLTLWLDPLDLWRRRHEDWLAAVDAVLPMTWAPGDATAPHRGSVPSGDLGFLVVRGWRADLGPAWGFATTTPEPEPAEVVLAFRPRPTVAVRVVGADGRPLARHAVRIAARLDPEDYDWCALDRSLGLVRAAVGPAGAVAPVAWKAVVTDADGRARVRMPRGLGHAALVEEGGHFAFVATAAEDAPTREVSLVVDLAACAREAPTPVRFLDPAGEPLAGAKVRFAVANDAPWIRQFPPLVTDADGKVRVSGFAVGARLAALVEHPALSDLGTRERGVAWTETTTWTGAPLELAPLRAGRGR